MNNFFAINNGPTTLNSSVVYEIAHLNTLQYLHQGGCITDRYIYLCTLMQLSNARRVTVDSIGCEKPCKQCEYPFH